MNPKIPLLRPRFLLGVDRLQVVSPLDVERLAERRYNVACLQTHAAVRRGCMRRRTAETIVRNAAAVADQVRRDPGLRYQLYRAHRVRHGLPVRRPDWTSDGESRVGHTSA